MRNAARVIVIALATTVMCEGAVRAVGPGWPEVNQWREPLVAAKVRRMDALHTHGGTDVVFAGSSQMLFAGDPTMLRRDLGVPWSAYNAALWGAPPVVNEHWLIEVVAPRLRPKAVVLGVSPVDFVAAETDTPIAGYFNAAAVRRDWIGSLERMAARWSALVRHRRSLRSYSVIVESVQRKMRGEPGPRMWGAGLDLFGRMRNRDADRFRGGAAARELVAGIVRNGWSPSEEQRLAFRRTIHSLKQLGIETVVVEMAVSAPMIDLLGGEKEYASFRSFLREQTDGLGVRLLDTAGGVTDTRFFIDYDHVNRSGANVFNTVIGRLLRDSTPGAFRAGLAPAIADRPLAPALATDLVGPAVPEPAPPTSSSPMEAPRPAPSIPRAFP